VHGSFEKKKLAGKHRKVARCAKSLVSSEKTDMVLSSVEEPPEQQGDQARVSGCARVERPVSAAFNSAVGLCAVLRSTETVGCSRSGGFSMRLREEISTFESEIHKEAGGGGGTCYSSR